MFPSQSNYSLLITCEKPLTNITVLKDNLNYRFTFIININNTVFTMVSFSLSFQRVRKCGILQSCSWILTDDCSDVVSGYDCDFLCLYDMIGMECLSC
jgi:hypothetical protein